MITYGLHYSEMTRPNQSMRGISEIGQGSVHEDQAVSQA
jgi:hypothetical protein